MANYAKNSSRVITFVLMIAFALLAGVIGYATFKGGAFELRSRAAKEEVILKQWTFDSTKEGWVARDLASDTVRAGNYTLVIGKDIAAPCRGQVCPQIARLLSPLIEHTSVATTLKYPLNKFKIRLSISPASTPKPTCEQPPPCAYLRRPCPYAKEGVTYCPLAQTGSETGLMPEPVPSKVQIDVSYRFQGKKVFETPVPIAAIADGVARDFSFDFPKDVTLKRIDEIKISFDALRKMTNTRISISDISIVGLKEIRPTATKVPPNPTQTFQGVVIKAGISPQGEANVSQYRLLVSSGDERRSQQYQLVQAKTDSECRWGVVCSMIARRPVEIDFSQYVGKQVVVTGTVVYPVSSGKGDASWTMPQKEGTALPIIYVTSIKVASGIPTPTVPPGCSYQQVQCFKAPCDPVLVCSTPGYLQAPSQ